MLLPRGLDREDFEGLPVSSSCANTANTYTHECTYMYTTHVQIMIIMKILHSVVKVLHQVFLRQLRASTLSITAVLLLDLLIFLLVKHFVTVQAVISLAICHFLNRILIITCPFTFALLRCLVLCTCSGCFGCLGFCFTLCFGGCCFCFCLAFWSPNLFCWTLGCVLPCLTLIPKAGCSP